MPFDAKPNPLQTWLQQRYAKYPDFRYLKIQCQDEQGLFWHKRHLCQQVPKQLFKMRFVKRVDYKDIQHLRISRVDGHLSPPWLLYPQPLSHGLLFSCICLLLAILMVWLLKHLPVSFWPWMYPTILCMLFFQIHEQLLHTLLTWKQASRSQANWLLQLPSSLKWPLRAGLFMLFFISIGMPVTNWLQTLEHEALKTMMAYGVAYLIAINVLDTVLKHGLRRRHPTVTTHYFVLQLHLVNAQQVDFAYTGDEAVLHALKQHLQQQQPCLQDACDAQTQT